MKKKKQPVRNHPRPFRSPLWPHVDLIRSERQAHKTWEEIAQKLQREFGITTHFTTIYNFLKRVSERNRKGKRKLPLGYDPVSDSAPSAQEPPPDPQLTIKFEPPRPSKGPNPSNEDKPLDYVERINPYKI